jgi:DNA-binding transcriptional LysR family regulator
VSFDSDCFYRRAAAAALLASGRSLDVVLDCPSAHGVQQGVRNGLGVAVIGRRRIVPSLVEISDGLPAFPAVCHVLRSGKRLTRDLDTSLADAIVQEMRDLA